jgi:hypothetical protein
VGSEVTSAVGVPVKVRVRTLVAFCEPGDETEVWVPFCEGAVPLPEEEPLPEAVMEAVGRVRVGAASSLVVLGMDVPVASAVSVKAVPVEVAASEENGQWKGMEEEEPVPDEVGPGPW